MDRSYQSCSGIPGEHIFFKRVFLILRRCILTTLVLSRPHIYYALCVRSVGHVRPVPTGTLAPRLEVNKCRRVVMIIVAFEVSGIKCNGMKGRSLFVEDGGDGSGGVD